MLLLRAHDCAEQENVDPANQLLGKTKHFILRALSVNIGLGAPQLFICVWKTKKRAESLLCEIGPFIQPFTHGHSLSYKKGGHIEQVSDRNHNLKPSK